MSENELQLFWLRPDDKEYYALRDLYEAAAKIYNEELIVFSGYNIVTDRLMDLADDIGEGVETVLAFDEDEFIGYFQYALSPHSFAKHDIYISEFYITEAQRRKGYGTKLAEMIIRSVETQALDFSMFVIDNNIPAKNLWDKVFRRRFYTERMADGNIRTSCYDRENISFYYWTKL